MSLLSPDLEQEYVTHKSARVEQPGCLPRPVRWGRSRPRSCSVLDFGNRNLKLGDWTLCLDFTSLG